MKAGISFILGLLLAFVLVFAYWLRTQQPVQTKWNAVTDRALAQVD